MPGIATRCPRDDGLVSRCVPGILRAAIVLALFSPRPAPAFSLSDIEYWAGEGTNRAALVVNWHDGKRPQALAWGYAWDGAATAEDMLTALAGTGTVRDAGTLQVQDAIDGADPRLYIVLDDHGGTAGRLVAAVGYDLDNDGGSFSPDRAADADDHFVGTNDSAGGYWVLWSGHASATYERDGLAQTSGNVQAIALSNRTWYVLNTRTAQTETPFGRPVSALRDPFGVAVVSYTPGTAENEFDWINGNLFTNAAMALGRPTVDTTGDGDDIPVADAAPVVPVYPAFRAHELAVVGQGGELVLAFDHRVQDNPANPYGVDFIVFGNAAHATGAGEYWANGDPNATTLGGPAVQEMGTVSVSQDGTNWFVYTGGPYADVAPPTLGRLYDPDHPDAALGAWNEWWGAPTNPERPLPPNLVSANWVGMTVAEIARRYRGSAGGRGFDIGAFALPPDPITGRKWIRYVRVVPSGALNPEVDAIADVAPAAPNELWSAAHFAWLGDPALESDAADPDGDRVPNLLEYVLGWDPTAANAMPPLGYEVVTTGTVPLMVVRYDVDSAVDDVRHRLSGADSLVEAAWAPSAATSVDVQPNGGTNRVTVTIPLESQSGFVRLEVYHEK